MMIEAFLQDYMAIVEEYGVGFDFDNTNNTGIRKLGGEQLDLYLMDFQEKFMLAWEGRDDD